MRKFILFVLCCWGLLFSCSDGDLEIETIDFDSVDIEYCTDPVTDEKNILFKINEDEALILELESGVLDNGVVGDTITTESDIPDDSQLTYRIFSDDVDDDYFCDDIPVVSPTVLEEVEAEDGLVIIETMVDPDDDTQFIHTISLSGISFVTEDDERITNLSISDFGDVYTDIPD